MFGSIARQVTVHCVAAILLIPLRYGHLKVRRWAKTFSLTLLWFWLVVRAPLVAVFFLMTMTAN